MPLHLDAALLPRYTFCEDAGDFSRFGSDSRLGEALILRQAPPSVPIVDLTSTALATAFSLRDVARAAPLGLVNRAAPLKRKSAGGDDEAAAEESVRRRVLCVCV